VFAGTQALGLAHNVIPALGQLVTAAGQLSGVLGLIHTAAAAYRPGAGKSTAARYFAGGYSNGTLEGCFHGEPQNIAYIASEAVRLHSSLLSHGGYTLWQPVAVCRIARRRWTSSYLHGARPTRPHNRLGAQAAEEHGAP
jgi:hypothetical protein